MAKKFLYTVLAGVSLLFAGCSEDLVGDYVQPTEKHFGEEIVFGGSASYNVSEGAKDGTRTVYGGYENITDGAEPVYWIKGDQVRLYSPDAAVKTADYSVTATATDATGKATQTGLSKIGDAGLQWGGAVTHTFYGAYPIPANNSLKTSADLVGEIPVVQTPVSRTGSGDYVFAPDMKYAYMVARTQVLKDEIGNKVHLKFMPIATAVEVTLINNSGSTLDFANVLLHKDGQNLSGKFQAKFSGQITNGEYAKNENGETIATYDTQVPSISTIANESYNDYVSIPLYSQGLLGDPTTIANGKSITFTAFILPTEDITNIDIVIQTLQGTKTGKTSGITINMSKKNYLRNLSLAGTEYNQSNWIKYVNDDAYVNQLSIPGAGAAASGNLVNEANSNTYRQQDLTIEGLWNYGVRCFEFSIDVATNITDANGTITTYGDISTKPVLCNGHDCGINLAEAVSAVKTQLEIHPEEFAMVILTYQTTGGYKTRDPHSFMHQINAFWEDVKLGTNDPWDPQKGCGTGLYDPKNANVGNSRGKLFCIARPTSEDQDYGEHVLGGLSGYDFFGSGQTVTPKGVEYAELNVETPHEHIMVIKGWGALKDKWIRRGYTSNSERGTNKTYSDNKLGRPFDTATGFKRDLITESNYHAPTTGLSPNFSYDILVGSGTSQKAWVQEWARVSNMESEYNWDFQFFGNGVQSVYWGKSYDEKLRHVEECMNYAIAGKVEGHSNVNVFINSLCGYFVDKNIEQSYIPCALTDWNTNNGSPKTLSLNSDKAGLEGDIATFASTINDAFYDMLQDVTSGYTPGSLGIILMDRVGVAESSKKIPAIIVANNFQFQMNQTPEVTKFATSEYTNKDKKLVQSQTRSAEPTEPTITWE